MIDNGTKQRSRSRGKKIMGFNEILFERKNGVAVLMNP